jgi:hypothetical protein
VGPARFGSRHHSPETPGAVADKSVNDLWRPTQMNATKLIGIVLIIAGCLGLAYGGFTYTKETTGMKIGPLELKVQEKETVSIPLIASAAGIALGVFLLVAAGKK